MRMRQNKAQSAPPFCAPDVGARGRVRRALRIAPGRARGRSRGAAARWRLRPGPPARETAARSRPAPRRLPRVERGGEGQSFAIVIVGASGIARNKYSRCVHEYPR